MEKTITRKDIGELLNKSEKHAIEYRSDNTRCLVFYERQIEKGYLSMTVSAKNVKRAIGLLKQLVNKVFEAGFSLTVDYSGHQLPASAVLIDGLAFPFRIKERMKIQYVQDKFYPEWRRRAYLPTNQITIEFYTDEWHWKPSKVFGDTKYTKLEDKIDDIIPYLIKAGEELKERIRREEIERKEKEERLRIQKEHEQRIEARAYIVKSVMKDIQLYEKAKIIREYCDVVEPKVKSTRYYGAILIARSFADWIDPTVDYVDEQLSELYEKSDFLT